jgi:hypothetical protein
LFPLGLIVVRGDSVPEVRLGAHVVERRKRRARVGRYCFSASNSARVDRNSLLCTNDWGPPIVSE